MFIFTIRKISKISSTFINMSISLHFAGNSLVKMSFQNKVVIVTGASSGIGAATAIQFIREGANVAIVGRNEQKLKNIEEQCIRAGGKPLVIRADVSKDDEAESIIEKTVEKFGKLDVLVNNAGFGRNGTILDGKVLEAYDEIMKTNVRAVINLTVLAVPYLVKSKGNIVNISSIAALCMPLSPEFIAYGVSKAALDHFTRGAALELSSFGVRVNSVNPGPVMTDFFKNAGISLDPAIYDRFRHITPLVRIGEPHEIADLIFYLAGDKAKSITGSVFVSDNGMLLKR